MKKICYALLVGIAFSFTVIAPALGAEIYYARCNLKVLKGNNISWVNWQAAPTFIPAGTKLNVIKKSDSIVLRDPQKDSEYILATGAKGDVYLEKFVSKKPLNLKKYSKETSDNIKNTVARVEMTKEEVYIAMGPPAKVSAGKTNNMTYMDIMKYDLWIYARRRFGKNIGIQFDSKTGKVDKTEGIWK